jgi:flagellar motor protein MotB
MNNDPLLLGQMALRGIDSNSLLRLYDQASALFRQSPSQVERAKAQKTVQRIAGELYKRHIRL